MRAGCRKRSARIDQYSPVRAISPRTAPGRTMNSIGEDSGRSLGLQEPTTRMKTTARVQLRTEGSQNAVTGGSGSEGLTAGGEATGRKRFMRFDSAA
jgi:hypothetical protein